MADRPWYVIGVHRNQLWYGPYWYVVYGPLIHESVAAYLVDILLNEPHPLYERFWILSTPCMESMGSMGAFQVSDFGCKATYIYILYYITENEP